MARRSIDYIPHHYRSLGQRCEPKSVSFYHILNKAELWFGSYSSEKQRELSLEEIARHYSSYPMERSTLRSPPAPSSRSPQTTSMLQCSSEAPVSTAASRLREEKSILGEALIVEKVSKSPHPYII
ncbi:hypothetical protein BDP55DRAFT_768881 [Colletotrichum godetiae]|uniref:Uncharacterized protein n=1 Tax=Colletotrichum godetiae TaxID=1209918 RepID=A0AAJ0AJ65_9PEZI|nr:uncharacterized protein BDP55DRAFT_768881 [Colletotrichum godetiae]KAK1674876.1 hypothetical protein BDP55DRAFT_768881 [Colletotrichum godetiae]